MATFYTSDKKIGALDPITGTLSAADEFVVNKNGDTLKTSVTQVEAAMFAAKTAAGTSQAGDVVVVRRGSSILQQEVQSIIPATTITDAQISNSAAIVDTKLFKITTAGKVGGGAITDGTIAGSTAINTSGAIATSSTLAAGNTTITGTLGVSGGFNGNLTGNVTGNVTGNAGTATTLQTARTIAISGDVTGTATSFNGSANIAISSEITAGSIVNSDINNAAAIGLAKLATGALPTGITVASANIVDGTIVNADINASAAIGLAKLATGALPTGITVASANIVDANVTTAKIADANVTTAKIADANVTTAKLATATQNALLPAGAVMPFAMNSAPAGWLAANGDAVSRSTYAALFAAIGTTHGTGDGSTTFNLPDLRGIFVRGSGSQTIGGISYSGTVATRQNDAFQGHYHAGSFLLNSGAVNFGGTGASMLLPLTVGGVVGVTTDGTNGTPRSASETRPANIALLYCIKF